MLTFKVDNHEDCNGKLYIAPRQFITFDCVASGIRCDSCNGLWINPNDNFFIKLQKIRGS